MKRRGCGVSLGTLLMLLLTALVVGGCALFLAMIARGGGAPVSLAHALSTQEPQATPAPTQSASAVPEPTLTPQPTDAPPTPAPVTITLAAAGTVYAPKAVRESARQRDGSYDFSSVFSGLLDTLSGADLAIATLETTTAGRDKGFGNYNTAPELLDALRACGVDLLSLATEHALDKGYDGLELTVSELTARGLACAGANPDGAAGQSAMLRVGGVQVAVLAYAYGLSDEGARRTDGDSQGALARLEVERMVRDITQARVSGANLVVVLPHWGTKNKQDTPDTLHRMARTLAEAGADVILGAHPNVAQGTERLSVKRADGLEHEAVVCYSLGTLLTDARTAENTAGMIAHLSVTYDPATRRTTLGELYCTPVYVACQREQGETVYRVVDAESAPALEPLTQTEREAAQQAVRIVRDATADGQEGQG
ncbi:MAG: CapA family protein [Candidatus Ventricola sp.]